MKILMLNHEFPPIGGGAANANYYLLKEFSRDKNIQVDLITTSAESKFEIEEFSSNIRIFKIGVRKNNLHYWKASEILCWTWKATNLSRELLNKNKYSLCHCWFGWPSGIIGYLNKDVVPYIIALRGSDVPGYNPRLRMLDNLVFSHLSKILWKNARNVVANSEMLKELALKNIDCRIDIIPNAIDAKEFVPDRRRKKANSLRLICVSRLIERKGIKYLIEAMQKLDNVNLKIIGDGNQKNELEELSKRLGVANRVEFLGYVPHNKISKCYRNSDVFVLPSLNEGMSNTVLEAMASGLALIITDTGGTKELLKGNGLIVPKENSDSIANAVKRLSSDRNMLTSMKKKSRQIAAKRSWDKIAKKYLELYEKCI